MLDKILSQLYQDAFMQEGKPQKRKLQKGGLHVSLVIKKGKPTLKIARDKDYPSLKEWQTCLDRFPYYVGPIEPRKIVDGDKRKALIAELPSRVEVAEQLNLF